MFCICLVMKLYEKIVTASLTFTFVSAITPVSIFRIRRDSVSELVKGLRSLRNESTTRMSLVYLAVLDFPVSLCCSLV
mgnify:CR=1 FL=1